MKHKQLGFLLMVLTLILLLPILPIVSAAWETNGIPICTEVGYQYYPDICAAENGSAIVTWQDPRVDEADIYAQKISETGEVEWTINGTSICSENYYQAGPDICTDGAGGAIIAWYDWRGADYDIYVQKVNSTGNAQWDLNGIPICTETGNQMYPEIIADGAGGAIIAWQSGLYVYAQKVNSTGVPQWGANGTRVCLAVSSQGIRDLCGDGNGGAIFVWVDNRGSGNDLYVQNIDSTGAYQWDSNGIPVCMATGDQDNPKIISDSVGGAIIAWEDPRSGFSDIYAQRINSSGDIQWTVNGTAICTGSQLSSNPCLVEDGSGGAIITWDNFFQVIYGQRISSAGTQLWKVNGTALNTAIGVFQSAPKICSDGEGGAIVAWRDFRPGAVGIYAQRINGAGVLQWVANGTVVSTPGAGSQSEITLCNTGIGKAIIAWQDSRNGNTDVYAMGTSALDTGEKPGIPGFIILYIAIAFLSMISIYWRKRIN